METWKVLESNTDNSSRARHSGSIKKNYIHLKRLRNETFQRDAATQSPERCVCILFDVNEAVDVC